MPGHLRRHFRFPVENSVFVELASPEFGGNEPSSIVRGKTRDISRGGLRISLERKLLVGAILQVALQLPADAGTLYLIAEVRWSKPLPVTGSEPAWGAGLALLDSDGSDIDKWVQLLAALER